MESKNDVDTRIAVCKPKGLGIRHVQTLLLFLGIFFAFGMRVNLSIAIVAMTDYPKDNTYDWSLQTQTTLLSSFTWALFVMQVPSGEIAARFGAKILMLVCLGVNSLVVILIPHAAYYGGWQLVCACRVLQGLTQGVIYPCIHHLIGKWIPLEEKSFLGTIIYAGAQFGMAMQFMMSGFISEYWGWSAIFYVNGILGAIWTVIYLFLGASTPQSSRYISKEECLYIQQSIGYSPHQKKMKTPWWTLCTSMSFIALIIAQIGQLWGTWTLLTLVPSYMDKVLGVEIKSNGVLSSLPYIAIFLMGYPFGYFSDLALKKKWLNINTSRKLSNSVGFYGPAIALLGLSYTPAGNVTIAVVLLTFVVGLNAGHFTGYLLVHIDMAPNFAGTMMGICNGIGNFISIFTPIAAGQLINDETDPDEWRKVFYLTSFIYIFCNTIFIVFGTSERQSWNDPEEVKDKEDSA